MKEMDKKRITSQDESIAQQNEFLLPFILK